MNQPQERRHRASEAGRIDLFLGRRIADVRETKGISLETLAVLTETPSAMLAEYEAGARKMPSLLLFRISQALGVTLNAIFSDEAPANPAAPASQ